MSRLFMKKFITSIILLVFFISFAMKNALVSYKPIINSVKEALIIEEATQNSSTNSITNVLNKINSVFEAIENAVNENVFDKYNFIETYGYLQKLMGKNEVNDFEVVKDEGGQLHYTYFTDGPNDILNILEITKGFKNNLENKDSKLIYLMTPDKYIIGKTNMEIGIPYNYANETADNFLSGLKENNIDYVDFRTFINNSDKTADELFYRTDHHWRIETAFDAYLELVDVLNQEYGENLDPNGYFTDKNNYNFETYESCYLGSMGRKVGKYYSGVDDFTLVYPKFSTSFNFYGSTNGTTNIKQGRFEEALINAYALNYNKDIYSGEGDKYFSYLTGNQGFVHIENNNIKDGVKMVFIKDSYAVPVAAFMSTVASDVYLIDPRYYDENILDTVNELNCDYVFISFYPENLTEEFFKLGQ